ncbi:MAG: hypothetical protein J3R72DRAFT_160007 [Linnemannia gamsii]|nr:MAG: hypothetical protein J3R72DRAFT_160007 [Linnemannia gamsii]
MRLKILPLALYWKALLFINIISFLLFFILCLHLSLTPFALLLSHPCFFLSFLSFLTFLLSFPYSPSHSPSHSPPFLFSFLTPTPSFFLLFLLSLSLSLSFFLSFFLFTLSSYSLMDTPVHLLLLRTTTLAAE